jgi:hypothetical protein
MLGLIRLATTWDFFRRPAYLRGAGSFLLLVLAGLAARAHAADRPGHPTAADLIGPRGIALSAHRGLAIGNEGIFSNPASLAARRAYAFEGAFVLERDGSRSPAQIITGSVADSQSGPLSAGFAYNRVKFGPVEGSDYVLALAMAVMPDIYLGVAGRLLWLNADTRRDIRAATGDAALYWVVGKTVTLGVTGYNLVPVEHPDQAPLGMGVGLGFGPEEYHLAADWRGDFDRHGKLASSYGVGAEYVFSQVLPVRAGYLVDDILGGQWISFGAGVMSQAGVGIDLAYRQAIGHADRRTLAVSVKLFLPASE